MSGTRYEVSEDMVLDIARDRRNKLTWVQLSDQYGIPPKSLQRAYLRKSAEMYGPERTRALLDHARQQAGQAACPAPGEAEGGRQ